MHTIPVHIEVEDCLIRHPRVKNEIQITVFDQSVRSDRRLPLFTFTCGRLELAEILMRDISDGRSSGLLKDTLSGKMHSS